MDVARIDQRHHEGRGPGLQVFLIDRPVALRLLRASKTGRQRERIVQDGHKAEILGDCLERRAPARRRAAGQRAAHVAHAALDAGDRRTKHALGFLLHEESAEFERYEVEAAGKYDAGAGRFRRGFMRLDHLTHPYWLAAEIEVIGACGRAGCDQLRAVELIRSDRRDHRLGLIDHRLQRSRIAGVGHDQGRIGRRADRVAHRGKLVEAASGHRPFRSAVARVMRRQIFGDELPGEAGCAIDNDVELRRGLHSQFLEVLAGRFRTRARVSYFLP